jgi:hypothetical protein
MNTRYRLRKLTLIGTLLLGAILLGSGCVAPSDYQDWQWKQYNPEYKPLPGDPSR